MRLFVRVLVLCLVLGNVAWAADADLSASSQPLAASQADKNTNHDDGTKCDPAVCHHCGHASTHFLGVPSHVISISAIPARLRAPDNMWPVTERSAAPPTRPPAI
ncbi:hypothetical protein [Thiohalobacter sp.]|uniref:hypothetical protein n=1 Tax=Thiohalobacter sp. TaxID=2025948 RepID=UPI00260BD481|nr:hypothetical protein [Thiohalobacter sp.]